MIIQQSTELGLLHKRLEDVQLSLGRLETQVNRRMSNGNAWDFQVFSQWNEDGILQWILEHTTITNRQFVEFGVEDYRESNTRFLLKKDQWNGLVIDSDGKALQRLHEDNLTWRHGLRTSNAFITRDNINNLISEQGLSGDIGLLSIDIDGNDYWIWHAIEVISPRIVITEYNALFPPESTVSIPYQEDFNRVQAHPSLAYWGASLAAFEYLAHERGYSLVAINNAGSNAFFVRNDVLTLRPFSAKQLHHYPRFREARDSGGKLLDLTPRQLLELIAELTVIDVTTGKAFRIRELLRSYASN